MVTIELSKPKGIDLGLPNNDFTCGRAYSCGGENRSLTILLGDNNKLISYMGILEAPIVSPKKMKYGNDGIRKELLNRNRLIQEYTGDSKKGLTVIIKPSKKCNFKNLVDILDEMTIANIGTYAIVNDFTPEETKLLASN